MVNYQNIDEKLEKFYGGNPRELPLYTIPEAAGYLKMPARTLRRWVCGDNAESKTRRPSEPVIQLPNSDRPMLSFMNLVEAYVLSSIRRIENVRFDKVRTSLNFLEINFPSPHPFADNQFWVDRFDLYVDKAGSLICTSRHGQIVIREVVAQYLRRIDRDEKNIPIKIYPFSKPINFDTSDESAKVKKLEDIPRNISIDPLVSFGRPTLAGTGISTNVIAGRFNAGESREELAKDYDITEAQVEEAIDYEGSTRRVA
ncbi:MAG: DUF433 domain-containing protein [Acidobacteria bacterium]|nr:DUF433 domain-containing protein [Acidobacteriota bacterium]